MIVQLIQEITSFNMQYRFSQGNKTICLATAPFQKGSFNCNLQFASNEQLELYYCPTDTRWGGGLHERLSFKILQNGERIGHLIGGAENAGRFFGGFPCTKISFNEHNYTSYTVGLGKNGIFLCLYQNNRLVAIAKKNPVVIDYHDMYTLYIDEDVDFQLMAIACLYLDLTCYGDLGEVSVKSIKKEILYTPQKGLLAKFDKDFIPRICARDGSLEI